jgi:hypothetical protein
MSARPNGLWHSIDSTINRGNVREMRAEVFGLQSSPRWLKCTAQPLSPPPPGTAPTTGAEAGVAAGVAGRDVQHAGATAVTPARRVLAGQGLISDQAG